MRSAMMRFGSRCGDRYKVRRAKSIALLKEQMVMRLIPIVLAVGALTLPATAWPSSGPHGVYTTKITGKPAALNGRWRIEFLSGNVVHTFRNGHLVIVGKAVPIGGHRLRISDRSGSYACSRSEGTGVYAYRLSRNRVTFSAVTDKCVGRKLVLTTKPFVR